MKGGREFGQVDDWGIACLSFAANILDDAANGFLDYYRDRRLPLGGSKWGHAAGLEAKAQNVRLRITY